MRFDPGGHHRRLLRLRGYDYSQPGAYFVTVCTKDGEGLFGEISDGSMRLNVSGEMVQECWVDLPRRYPYVELDAFVVMPNHIHGIIVISVGAIHELPVEEYRTERRKMSLPKIIGYAKMNTAKRINQLRHTYGAPVWQRSYYEHVIRDEASLNRIRQYIAENPLRWADDEENPVNMSNQ